MKKQTAIVTGACALLLAGGTTWGFASAKEQTSVKEVTAPLTAVAGATSSALSLEQAVKQAEDFVGGKMVKAKQDTDDGKDVFEIDVRTNKETFEFTFDQHSGNITEIDGNLLVAESQAKPALSQEEAENRAKEESGLTDVKEIELELENEKLIYKIEFTLHDEDTDIIIDAETGDVLSMDEEMETPSLESRAESQLSLEEVNTILQSAFGNDVNVIESELDYDDGVAVYELEAIIDNTEYDIDIHAETGEILKQERD
ncbi:PepSY domain-containing protein [Shouchella sp. JSM 1781072]|uniref:PepSY domain-containing protein n=1 Tax=Bacillaceae TaxID=186817 RepID=UPI00159BEEC0|nr:PepSY domain-containing protein [Bacillus sp. Marseille-P3800]